MRPRRHSIAATLSIKPLLQRALFVTLVFLGLALIYIERSDHRVASGLRAALLDVVMPVADILTQPVQAFNTLTNNAQSLVFAYQENQLLKSENERLLTWRNAALRLEAENRSLRQLMHYQPSHVQRFVTGRVIGGGAAGLSHTVRLDIGRKEGALKHQPVINAYGLAGRMVEVSGGYSEVLLLTDMSSRIPVTVEPSGLKALLVGAHDELPYLKFADPKAKANLGDVVMSAGDGQVMPAGLHIGKVFAQDGEVMQVRPAFKQGEMQFLRMIQPSVTHISTKQ